MAFGKLIALGIVVAIIAALLVVQTEVTPINPYPGAVAYAHPSFMGVAVTPDPTANSYNPAASATLDSAGTLTGLPVQLTVTPLKYTAPAPVKKPLWQSIFPAGSFVVAPPRTIAPGGCTVSSVRWDNSTLHVRLFATMTISGGAGGVDNWTSATKDFALPVSKGTYTCGFSAPTVVWTPGTASVDFEPGAYYFQGWGTYTVSVKVFKVDSAGATPVQISSLSQSVTVSPSSFSP
jgi:hypothetical protein